MGHTCCLLKLLTEQAELFEECYWSAAALGDPKAEPEKRDYVVASSKTNLNFVEK